MLGPEQTLKWPLPSVPLLPCLIPLMAGISALWFLASMASLCWSHLSLAEGLWRPSQKVHTQGSPAYTPLHGPLGSLHPVFPLPSSPMPKFCIEGWHPLGHWESALAKHAYSRQIHQEGKRTCTNAHFCPHATPQEAPTCRPLIQNTTSKELSCPKPLGG